MQAAIARSRGNRLDRPQHAEHVVQVEDAGARSGVGQLAVEPIARRSIVDAYLPDST